MTQSMGDTNKIILLKENKRPPHCYNPARPLPVLHSSAYCMAATLQYPFNSLHIFIAWNYYYYARFIERIKSKSPIT